MSCRSLTSRQRFENALEWPESPGPMVALPPYMWWSRIFVRLSDFSGPLQCPTLPD
jgi:hypothetical protein